MQNDLSISPRFAGLLAIAAPLVMVAGAICWNLSGIDLSVATAEGTMDQYLRDLPEARTIHITGLSIWLLGAFLLGAMGTAISRLPSGDAAATFLGRLSHLFGAPVAMVAFLMMMTVAARLSGQPDQAALADSLAWLGYRLDCIATMLMAGFGPAFLSWGGRTTWAPRWLVIWGGIAAVTGVLVIVAMIAGGNGLSTYGMLIVPVGLGWMIATGVVLLRRAPKTD